MLLNHDEIYTLKEYIYSKLSDIQIELEKRATDRDLQLKIEKFFGKDLLINLKSRPKAVFSRSIFTPNLEFEYFMDVASSYKLDPLLLEYNGKFVSKNIEKYHLCKLFLLGDRGKKNGINYNTHRIVNFNINEGKPMDRVETDWGEPVKNFHHSILETQFPKISERISDFTTWFNKTRAMNDEYYFYYLSLFVCNAVLFENFLIDDNSEVAFMKKNVFMSFRKVKEYFGYKPLIYPLLPLDNEKSLEWVSYRGEAKKNIEQYIMERNNDL